MTDESVFVREGTLDDTDECIRIAIASIGEVAIVPPEYSKLKEHIYAALTHQQGIMGVIGPKGGTLEGGVLLRMGEFWYSDELVLEAKCLYVPPDFRSAKGGRGKKLLEWAKKQADILDIPLAISVLSQGRMEAKSRLFERSLGQPAGMFFLHNGAAGGQELHGKVT
jgi:hypothetical protein